MSLRDHLDRANQVCAYLADFIPECQKKGSRAARYDVMAVGLELVNMVLSENMGPVLDVTSPQLAKSPLGDFHALIVWLTQVCVT